MIAQTPQVLKKPNQQKFYLLGNGIFVNTNIQKIFEKDNLLLRQINCHCFEIKDKYIFPMV